MENSAVDRKFTVIDFLILGARLDWKMCFAPFHVRKTDSASPYNASNDILPNVLAFQAAVHRTTNTLQPSSCTLPIFRSFH